MKGHPSFPLRFLRQEQRGQKRSLSSLKLRESDRYSQAAKTKWNLVKNIKYTYALK